MRRERGRGRMMTVVVILLHLCVCVFGGGGSCLFERRKDQLLSADSFLLNIVHMYRICAFSF